MLNVAARIFVAALASGVIFGFGLSLTGMLDPARVRRFLDIAGQFDPSLAFVLAGAVAVSSAGYLISRRLRHPLLDSMFHLPVKHVSSACETRHRFGPRCRRGDLRGWLGHERTLPRAGDRLLNAWTRVFLRLRRDDACRNPHP